MWGIKKETQKKKVPLLLLLEPRNWEHSLRIIRGATELACRSASSGGAVRGAPERSVLLQVAVTRNSFRLHIANLVHLVKRLDVGSGRNS